MSSQEKKFQKRLAPISDNFVICLIDTLEVLGPSRVRPLGLFTSSFGPLHFVLRALSPRNLKNPANHLHFVFWFFSSEFFFFLEIREFSTLYEDCNALRTDSTTIIIWRSVPTTFEVLVLFCLDWAYLSLSCVIFIETFSSHFHVFLHRNPSNDEED